MAGREAKVGQREWQLLLAKNRTNAQNLKTENAQNLDFFREVAAELDYADPELVERVYEALVKVAVRQLRKTRFVRLPDFVDAYLIPSEERDIPDPWDRSVKRSISKHYQMRFRPANRLRVYFAKVSDSIPD